MDATRHDRLRLLRLAAGHAQAADFARAAGIEIGTYRSHENGNRGFDFGRARAYATAMGHEDPGAVARWIIEGGQPPVAMPSVPAGGAGGAGGRTRAEVRSRPVASPALGGGGLPRDLPVFGTVLGGADSPGEFELRSGEVVEYVRRPPALAAVRDAFALYVVGESMVPRYRPGDLVFCHPHRAPANGCDVVVDLAPTDEGEPPAALLKELVRRGPTALTLAQYNPAREFSLPLDRIRSTFRVLTLAELLEL